VAALRLLELIAWSLELGTREEVHVHNAANPAYLVLLLLLLLLLLLFVIASKM
jgi:hypothetical protein